MTERFPAEVFPPGEFLRDELEARGWTQAYLAGIMNRPTQVINAIVAGRKEITPETAQGLADALGTSAEMWLNLQSAYRLSKVRKEDGETRRRARLYSLAPVKELIRRQWIANVKDTDALEKELKTFFESESMEPQLNFAARMSASYTAQYTPAQIAWACRARKLARAVSAATFQDAALEQGLVDLRQLVASEHDVRRVPKLLAEIGIRLVIVAHLPTTRIDGAAMWLNNQSPVVALSMRYDRIDNFWFTLCHELMHIKHGEGSLDPRLVGADRQLTEDKSASEQRADQEAQDFLVPAQEIETFMLRVGPMYSNLNKIIHFANRIRVHPGIVTGQLQFRTNTYTFGSSLLAKVRSAVIEAALSDGWGYTPPIR
jgi:HTH-type transcriptional regulator/antitoxin HigA